MSTREFYLVLVKGERLEKLLVRQGCLRKVQRKTKRTVLFYTCGESV